MEAVFKVRAVAAKLAPVDATAFKEDSERLKKRYSYTVLKFNSPGKKFESKKKLTGLEDKRKQYYIIRVKMNP